MPSVAATNRPTCAAEDVTRPLLLLPESFRPPMNRRVGVEAASPGSAFVALRAVDLDDILCVKEERIVTRDNCVSCRGLSLQLPVTHGRH